MVAENARADLANCSCIRPKTPSRPSRSLTRAKSGNSLDPGVADDFKYLATVADGEISIASRTLDNKRWIVAFLLDDGPVKYYRYDRAPSRRRVPVHQSRRPRRSAAGQNASAVIKARDGLELVCYLSLPPGADRDGDGRPDEPLPMVLDVHGGPWARDDWGFDARASTAGQSRLRRAERQLPRLDRLRQGVPQRRQQRVGRQNARRSARRRGVGRRQQDRRPRNAWPSWEAATAAMRRWSA